MYPRVRFSDDMGALGSARRIRNVLKRYRPSCCVSMYESPSLQINNVSMRRKGYGERRDSPSDLGEVVGVEGGKSTRERVTVSSAGSTALLDSSRGHDGAERLETRGRGVDVGEEREVALCHRRLVLLVQAEHLTTGCN
jgi:hypothetical protein